MCFKNKSLYAQRFLRSNDLGQTWITLSEPDSNYTDHNLLFNGMFKKDRLLDIIQNFILFSDDKKILAQYHQY